MDVSQVHGITRTTRGHPPSHYLFKIESFSLLVEERVEKYKSKTFEAAGHQWRLVLYPTGNKKSNGSDYISLYLEIKKTANLSLDWEVNVDFKLFVFDQIRNQYLVIKDMDVPVWRFFEMKTEWGFSQFLSQKTFNDAANGYLVDDCCIFGAEVLVIQRTLKLEKAVLKKPCGRKIITLKMDNLSRLYQEFYRSAVVSIDDIKWYLRVYPKGHSIYKDTHLSAFLELVEPNTLPLKCEVYVKFKLRLMDQIKSNHSEMIGERRFTVSLACRGFHNFVALETLYDSSNGYMVKDSLIVEAEFLLVSKVG
ncbi:hypothetical protein like AT3G17380 [Hibiscus trionum]|uniref:MATH domain-containing protein n=1 Tax=Hibiscus trionum TaxID=183268 RepID=A0A9W7HK78_HIBTR|nr:hypothetical protein like AT3G17380 [Hibiscus trionum]